MEKVVYILGAGFSAPLGLPVVSNFRFKSQEMFSADPNRYAHFRIVFDLLGELAVSKNYYQTDLFNIEDILSILEMRDYLEGRRLADAFTKYIKDVIIHYTPAIPKYDALNGNLPSNWEVALFGGGLSAWRSYGYFVAALLNLQVHKQGSTHEPKDLVCSRQPRPTNLYGIITLNYDLVPEMVWDYCRTQYTVGGIDEAFETAAAGTPASPNVISDGFRSGEATRMAKLHGSVDGGAIVPPTWSKGVVQDIVPAWNLAHRLLTEATQIRIVGYSLPLADSYVKYLLKSAATLNSFLKQIDVICLDPRGEARGRYDEFIQFVAYRFANENTSSYIDLHAQLYPQGFQPPDSVPLVFDKLETAHQEFMRGK